MLFKISIFFLFLGPLVLFHELGHFLFARFFNVRVEVFSFGFGPKLFKKKWGDTVYAFSLIPLGGYVKMFGDDPLKKNEIPEEERQYSFNHKGKMARFWIVFGGPLANFILAGCIFFLLTFVGETAPEVRLGVVSSESFIYQQGFRAGDVLKSVNGHNINSPVDFPLEQEKTAKKIQVRRGSELISITLNLPIKKFFEEFMSTPPFLRTPLLVDENSKKWGISYDSKGVDFTNTLDHMAVNFSGKKLFFFPVTSDSDKKGQFKYDTTKLKSIDFSSEKSKGFWGQLREAGFYPIDLVVKSVSMDSAADEAKLASGDIIISLDSKKTTSFEDLRYFLKMSKKKSVELKLVRKGELKKFNLIPKISELNGKKRKLLGVYSAGEFLPVNYVDIDGKSFFESFPIAFERTVLAGIKIFSGFKKLITSEVSFKDVGGPLSIGKVAADSFQTSLSYFFQLMALISVNLGVINLFPIPVLDGGHIVFLLFELVNRGPLSRRKLEIAQQFGLSLLLLLMVAALFNDFTRFF